MTKALPPPSRPLTYFKAGITDDWKHVIVFDLNDGDIVTQVIEANSIEGWLLRCVTDEKGRVVRDPVTGIRQFELVRGRFAILRPRSAA
jgi:hypothetical protein